MYLMFSLLSFLLSFYFFSKASGSLSLKKINMISWVFWYALIIQSFIASILIVYHIDGHYGVDKLAFDQSRIYGWIAVQYCMVFLPLSMWLTLVFTRRKVNNNSVLNNYIESKINSVITEKDKVYRSVLYFLSIFCVLSVLYSYLSVGMYPFQGYITGMNIAVLRQEVGRGFSGIVYIKNIFGLILTPILSYVFYCYYRLYREKSDLFFLIIMTFFSVCAVTFDYAKSPLAFYFLGFFFIKVMLGDNINYFKLLKYFILILIMLTLFYVITGFDGDLTDLFSSYNSGIIGRLVISQAFGTYLAFDLYPFVYDHIGFASLTDLFGESRERMAREIMLSINTQGIEDGTAGVINTLFIAEAWANWGVLGVAFSVIWVGIVIQLIYSAFIYSKKNPLNLGIYAYLCYKLPLTGGVNEFIYNPGLFIVIPFLFVTAYLVKLKVQRK